MILKNHFETAPFSARKRWDSNPRALSDNRISSAARYDHFDTLPRPVYYNGNGLKCQADGAPPGPAGRGFNISLTPDGATGFTDR